jgi:membrane-bound serine protease (ClpP class)
MGISGVIAIAAGGLMLFRTPGEGVSPLLVIGMSIAAGTLLAFVATKVVEARHRPVSTGSGAQDMIGRTAVARTTLQPRGQVYLHGELWEAETTAGDIAPGREVVVQGIDGLTLLVTPVRTHSTEGVTT